jgi:hypothetical protein
MNLHVGVDKTHDLAAGCAAAAVTRRANDTLGDTDDPTAAFGSDGRCPIGG